MLGTEMARTTQLKSVKNHKAFWNKYERPPKEEHWQWFIERKDLLVPQDVRERKGSFFTPQKPYAEAGNIKQLNGTGESK